ncbi:MAG: Cna B-type domain-containing protein [Ruminococcus sp.]|nr:Cna B-type domain-containing protein [Ruminococcus sp.]
MKEIRVTGLSEDQFLFVTIDLTGHDNAYFNKSWLVEEPNSSGDTFGTGESPLSEGGCRVIYNFVKNDGSGNYVPFDGKLVLGERRNGAILAPAADVNGAGNTNGTFICKNFVATGETHRLDIMQEGEEDTFTDWPLFEEPVETISVSVSKIWDDGSIQTNHSEDTVTVQLYKGTNFDTSTPIGNPVTIKGGDSHTWSGLIKLSSEQKYFVKEIEYSVENGAIYTATYDNNGNNGGNIQITNTRQDLSLTVKKEWVGEPNTSVHVKLYQSAKSDLSDKKEHGNITLSSSNNWTHTWENLPSGYYYSVEETALDDYTISYSSNNGTNQGNQTIIITNVKNKADIPKIDIYVEKTWSDTGHSNDSVEVELYQANRADAPESEWTKVSGFEKITLNQNNSWKYTFKDVPKYEGVYYFVKEVGCNTANGISYTATYDRNGANDTNSNTPIKITNAPQKMNVKVNKIWSDGESEHTNDKVVVNLYKSSEPNKTDFTNVVAIRSATLDITNKWSFNWENLDKGENIYYYVKEVEAVINNKNYCYEVSYSDNGKNNSAEINITNTQRMSVTVNKVWSDENADSKNEITVELYKSFNMGLDVNAGDFSSKEENKVTKVKELDLNKDNKWTAVFENLPIKDIDTADNNKEKLVYYYVKEKDVPDGYAVSYSKNGVSSMNRDITVTNTKLTDITIKKVWKNENGNDMSDNFPVNEIKFKLYRYKFVPPTITNEEGEIVPDEEVVKEFEENGYKYRPSAAEEIAEYTINSDGEWKKTIENLPTKEDGYKLYYYVEETTVIDDYSTSYSDDNFYVSDDTKTIINTKNKDTEFALTVTKTWSGIEDYKYKLDDDTEYSYVEDYENPVQVWNKPITVVLKRATADADWSNAEIEKEVSFTGSYTFTGLPMYKDNDPNQPYFYKVFEEKVNGYYTNYNNQLIQPSETGDGSAETEIINTHIKNTLNISKKWYEGQEPINGSISGVVVEVYRKLAGENKEINNSGNGLAGVGGNDDIGADDDEPGGETGGMTAFNFQNSADSALPIQLDADKTLSQIVVHVENGDYPYVKIYFDDDTKYVKVGWSGSSFIYENEKDSATKIPGVTALTDANGNVTLTFDESFTSQGTVYVKCDSNNPTSGTVEITYAGSGTTTTPTTPTTPEQPEETTASTTKANDNNKMNGTVTPAGSNYNVVLPQASNEFYINVELPNNVAYANGGLGTSIKLDGNYYWVNLGWDTSSSGAIKIKIPDSFSNCSLDGNAVEDDDIINKLKEKLSTVKEYQGQIWYAKDVNGTEISDKSGIKITEVYVLNGSSTTEKEETSTETQTTVETTPSTPSGTSTITWNKNDAAAPNQL